MAEQQACIFECLQIQPQRVVLQNLHQIPVLAEFMRVWSEPCIRMSDDLAALA